MTPPKLSDSQKHELVVLYRQGGHTMAALGQRFGVSTSTVGRILKLAAEEDEAPSAATVVDEVAPVSIAPVVTAPPVSAPLVRDPQPPQVDPSIEAKSINRGGLEPRQAHAQPRQPEAASESSNRRVRRRSSSGSASESLPLFNQGGDAPDLAPIGSSSSGANLPIAPAVTAAADFESDGDGDGTNLAADLTVSPRSRVDRPIKKRVEDDTSSAADSPAEARESRSKRRDSTTRGRTEPAPVDDGDDDLANDLELDDDLDLDEDDFEFGDDDGESGIAAVFGRGANPNQPIEIMPLEVSRIPNPCYLVVDRAAELVARPLEDFRELGQISPQDAASKTLPVFDNHRVARRFSARNQRIIKVPDANDLFQKTGPYLQAKGITHLLIDGQVYLL
ncbi:MAG TPA: hypothetical protein V6D46_09670 [Coleofasciculaceae cyanobacterium]